MTTVATTTWRQIPLQTKWACGAREPISYATECGEAHGLKFRVTSFPLRFVEVELDASDTYTVRYLRLKRNDYSRILLEEYSGVYCDQLGEILYSAVNK